MSIRLAIVVEIDDDQGIPTCSFSEDEYMCDDSRSISTPIRSREEKEPFLRVKCSLLALSPCPRDVHFTEFNFDSLFNHPSRSRSRHSLDEETFVEHYFRRSSPTVRCLPCRSRSSNARYIVFRPRLRTRISTGKARNHFPSCLFSFVVSIETATRKILRSLLTSSPSSTFDSNSTSLTPS